jgi:hypothetical protein
VASQVESEQRACYRMNYPRGARPILKIGSESYEVVEISEDGLRFDRGVHPPEHHTEVQGIICFRDGEQQAIEGTVIRQDGNETVMMLNRGVPFSRMMREQRYMLSKYPSRRTF